jgi:hypothetical protein
MSLDRRTAARWAVFLAMVATSLALYWAGTTAGPVIQAGLLAVLIVIACIAAMIR